MATNRGLSSLVRHWARMQWSLLSLVSTRLRSDEADLLAHQNLSIFVSE